MSKVAESVNNNQDSGGKWDGKRKLKKKEQNTDQILNSKPKKTKMKC